MHANHVSFLSVHDFFCRFSVNFPSDHPPYHACVFLCSARLSDGLERIRKSQRRGQESRRVKAFSCSVGSQSPKHTHTHTASCIWESVILFEARELLSVAPEETYSIKHWASEDSSVPVIWGNPLAYWAVWYATDYNVCWSNSYVREDSSSFEVDEGL